MKHKYRFIDIKHIYEAIEFASLYYFKIAEPIQNGLYIQQALRVYIHWNFEFRLQHLFPRRIKQVLYVLCRQQCVKESN